MFVLIAAMLAGGAKGIFEDPAYVIGVPLLALGVIGLLVILLPIGRARPDRKEQSGNPGDGKGTSSGADR
jgi:hypothetical protein